MSLCMIDRQLNRQSQQANAQNLNSKKLFEKKKKKRSQHWISTCEMAEKANREREREKI